jgi:uncharacterized membrane protein
MNFLNKTIKGGIFFLVPLVLIIIIIQKIFDFLKPLANTISSKLFSGSLWGYQPVYLIAIIIIIILCFLAGLIGASFVGKLMVKWVEDNILFLMPGYKLMKDSSQSILGMETGKTYPVVLAPIDGWMITFLIEKLDNGEIVVFVPGSPNPWSGNIMLFKETEVRPTNLTQRQAIQVLRQTGIGMNRAMNISEGKN